MNLVSLHYLVALAVKVQLFPGLYTHSDCLRLYSAILYYTLVQYVLVLYYA